MENSLIQNTNSLKNLPSDWRVFPFTNLIDDVSGGNLKTQKSEFLENGLIPIIDQGKDLIAGYIDDENVIVKTKTPHIVFGDHTRILKYIDFPFAMGADGTKVLKVKSNIEALEKYVYYFFQTLNIPETGYNRHFKYLKECLIPLPNLATQQKIANILDKADELRQYNKQLIEKYEALTQSLFLDMFGDPVKNEKKWEKMELGKISDMASGSTPSRTDDNNFIGNVPWVKTTEVNGKIINNTLEKISEEALKNSSCRLFPKGSIVIAMYGQGKTRGQIGILGIEAATNQACCVLRPSNKMNFQFLYYTLTMLYDDLRSLGRGGNQPNLNLGLLKSYELINPSIILQNQFAERVAVIETQKQQAQEALAKSEVLFQGLLQQAFNGELNTPPYGHPS